MRKILITNDDGIKSDGIRRLAEAAKAFGEVWVIAPAEQCSAMSHCINLRNPIDVYEYDFPVEGVHAYAIKGTPADCVRMGMLNILKTKADVVLSGINYGYNCGSDIQYSATVGAAMEAASSGVQAIALSEGMCDCHEVTDAYLSAMLEEAINSPLKRNQIWNINFPECKTEDFKGILRDRKVAENSFYIDSYTEEKLPDGGTRMRVHGVLQANAVEETDFKALLDNYISVGIVQNFKEP